MNELTSASPDKELLATEGWELECESPLSFRHLATGSFASGLAATCVLACLRSKVEDYATVANPPAAVASLAAPEELAELMNTVLQWVRIAIRKNTEDCWKQTYDLVFSPNVSQRITALRQDLGVSLTYDDPDTSYEEDVKAYAVALARLAKGLCEFYSAFCTVK